MVVNREAKERATKALVLLRWRSGSYSSIEELIDELYAMARSDTITVSLLEQSKLRDLSSP